MANAFECDGFFICTFLNQVIFWFFILVGRIFATAKRRVWCSEAKTKNKCEMFFILASETKTKNKIKMLFILVSEAKTKNQCEMFFILASEA